MRIVADPKYRLLCSGETNHPAQQSIAAFHMTLGGFL